MRRIIEHRHRLGRELYIGKRLVAVTICLQGKQALINDEHIFQRLEKVLLDSLKSQRCEAQVYLFMPDHVHILIEGKTQESDLWKCVVSFKQHSGYWLAQGGYEQKWQKDFYDHILREEDDLIKHVRYILCNPVRKGMVEKWKDYKFKGSTVYNFDEWK